jgi:hypothetical protein
MKGILFASTISTSFFLTVLLIFKICSRAHLISSLRSCGLKFTVSYKRIRSVAYVLYVRSKHKGSVDPVSVNSVMRFFFTECRAHGIELVKKLKKKKEVHEKVQIALIFPR